MKSTILIFLGMLLLPATLFGAGPAHDGTPGGEEMFQARVERLTEAGLTPEAARKALQAMIQSNFSPQQAQSVAQTIQMAHQQGLPTEALVAKLLEGVAKQATPAMTVRAVEHVAERYAYAYATARRLALNDRRQATVLGDIMAAGLAAGLTHQHMAAVVDSLQVRTRQMNMDQGNLLACEALLTVREMARQGVPPEDVVRMINQAMVQGLSAEAMRQARQAVSSRPVGQNLEALSRVYARALGQADTSGAGHHGRSQGAAGSQGGSGSSGGGADGGGGGAGGGSGGGSGGGGGGGGGGR